MFKLESKRFRHLLYYLQAPVVVLTLVVVGGTLGYYLLWYEQGGTWLDAFFMTLITITTVGYSEVLPLNDQGRIFTIVVSLTGISSLFYLFGVAMERLVELQLRYPREQRRMEEKIRMLNQHIILAGMGRMGREASNELMANNTPFVIIDEDEEVKRYAQEKGYLVITGDATEDAVLEQAGIMRAKGLIVTASDDASNAFIAMSARALNPALFIVVRADSDVAIRKLHKAGANRVINPYAIGGRRLVNQVVHPAVVDFLDATTRNQGFLGVHEVEVQAGSQLAEHNLRALNLRNSCGVNVLAILRQAERFAPPDPAFTIEAGDHLIVLGDRSQLQMLETMAAASAVTEPN